MGCEVQRVFPKQTKGLALLLAAELLFVFAGRGNCQEIPQEYRMKVAYLKKIPGFVIRPEAGPQPEKGAFLICVYEEYRLSFLLKQELRDASIGGRKVNASAVQKNQNLASCQILFIGRSAEKQYARILETANGSGTLTVGESKGFAEAGGMIELCYEEQALSMTINLGAAKTAQLKLDARFVSLAKRVLRERELTGV